jgi:hypothetical protein
MTEQAKKYERDDARKPESKANLGQKEAQQQSRSDAELARMSGPAKEDDK